MNHLLPRIQEKAFLTEVLGGLGEQPNAIQVKGCPILDLEPCRSGLADISNP